MKPLIILSSFLLLTSICGNSEVKLPSIISDHMVLEKASKVPLWGSADPGESLSVTLGAQTATTSADENGKWQVVLNLENFGPGPFELIIQGKNKVVISDVVIGAVWVASGQSNMAFTLSESINSKSEIEASANPLLRHFQVGNADSVTPLEDCRGAWIPASPQSSGSFSAVGYYFGKRLQNELNIPVGIIHSSRGGTPIEAWTSRDALDSIPDLKVKSDQILDAITSYPDRKKKFVEAFGAWLKATGREDRPVTDLSAFAGENVAPEGWFPVTLPGAVEGDGLPPAGAVWVRRSVEIPANNAKTFLNLDLGAIEGYDTVFWNGQLIKQLTFQDYPGDGYVRKGSGYVIPPNLSKAGENIIAIRIYSPVTTAKFPRAPVIAGSINLPGVWQARAEYEFPPLDAAQAGAVPRPPDDLSKVRGAPAVLFNSMINPLIPYAIRGVIWYQGEANTSRAWQYRTAFPLLINNWREKWGQGDFPFYFCQLPNCHPKNPKPGDNDWAELREAQASALSLPNTGQAVLIDLGEANDIHPRNKRDVGERLAKIALAKDYGKDIAYSGPVYESSQLEGSKIRVNFAHCEDGLTAHQLPATYDASSLKNLTLPLVRNSPASEIEGFAICGADKVWVWADAKIEGSSVLVWSDKVQNPAFVRYGWAHNPSCNLYNGSGLPASPFRTDSFPAATIDGKF